MGLFSSKDHGKPARPACGDKRTGKTHSATSGPWAWTDIDEDDGEWVETKIRTDILGRMRSDRSR